MPGIVECDNDIACSIARISVTAPRVSPWLVCWEHAARDARVKLQPDLISLVIDVPGGVQGTVPGLSGNVAWNGDPELFYFWTWLAKTYLELVSSACFFSVDRVVNSKISENIENRNKEGDQDNLNRVYLITWKSRVSSESPLQGGVSVQVGAVTAQSGGRESWHTGSQNFWKIRQMTINCEHDHFWRTKTTDWDEGADILQTTNNGKHRSRSDGVGPGPGAGRRRR